jgi:hypothetical protein
LAVLGIALVLVAALGGCTKNPSRISRAALERDFVHTFKRAVSARHRMETGVVGIALVSHVRPSCRPQEPLPPGRRDWRWSCVVRFFTPAGIATQILYAVRVDRYGCYSGTAGQLPPRVHDAVLGGTSRNPLAFVRTCP